MLLKFLPHTCLTNKILVMMTPNVPPLFVSISAFFIPDQSAVWWLTAIVWFTWEPVCVLATQRSEVPTPGTILGLRHVSNPQVFHTQSSNKVIFTFGLKLNQICSRGRRAVSSRIREGLILLCPGLVTGTTVDKSPSFWTPCLNTNRKWYRKQKR